MTSSLPSFIVDVEIVIVHTTSFGADRTVHHQPYWQPVAVASVIVAPIELSVLALLSDSLAGATLDQTRGARVVVNKVIVVIVVAIIVVCTHDGFSGFKASRLSIRVAVASFEV
jgi:hypothetical protein